MTQHSPLEQNLYWYAWHQRAVGALLWAPIAFLYFIDQYGLSTALRIQSVYYLAVVLFELPSGWFSDRFGRVPALRIAAASWIGAHLLFVLVDSGWGATGGQILLAVGFAFISGTDVTFHYDSLEALGREDEFDVAESTIRRQLLYAKALSAAAGGALAFVDLRLPFLGAVVIATAQLFFASRFRPVLATSDAMSPDQRPSGALQAAKLIRHPLLAWLTVYVFCQVVTIHLAAELGAPYIASVLDGGLDDPTRAAFVNGSLAAGVALVGAYSLGHLPRVTGRVGATKVLTFVALVPTLLLGAMSFISSVWLIPLLALRGVQSAASTVLVSGIIAGTAAQSLRATFLSFTSLLGRLGYGVALLLLSQSDNFSRNIGTAAIIGTVLVVLVISSRLLLPRQARNVSRITEHEHEELSHDHLHRHTEDHHRHDAVTQGPHVHPHVHPALTHRHPLVVDLHHF